MHPDLDNPDHTTRPVWAFPQLDRLSQACIRQLPGSLLVALTGSARQEFAETTARLLCLPSPLCAARVGEPLGEGGLTIDTGDRTSTLAKVEIFYFFAVCDTLARKGPCSNKTKQQKNQNKKKTLPKILCMPRKNHY